MKKVFWFSFLLVVGLVVSQFLPALGEEINHPLNLILRLLTMVGLSFIMIHVGYEFELDRSNLRQYGWDYVVAGTAATFPWILATLYFIFILSPSDLWGSFDLLKESLLVGRFSAPTSAGVLFSMLAAAGLTATWLFRKLRILAIFDDLDTILLMIPLKMLFVGLKWQMGVIILVMIFLLWLAWRFQHEWRIPISWPWVMGYSFAIVLISEIVHILSLLIDDVTPIHLEVLLPAFVVGVLMARPEGTDPHIDDTREGHQEGPETPEEQRVAGIVSGVFMLLVGLSLPPIVTGVDSTEAINQNLKGITLYEGVAPEILAEKNQFPGWDMLIIHTLVLTFLINLGKMFPALCYRREVPFKERLALAIGMFPRGEVGAGVLAVTIAYGLRGPMVTVALLSLALNLLMTGIYIWIVRKLMTHYGHLKKA